MVSQRSFIQHLRFLPERRLEFWSSARVRTNGKGTCTLLTTPCRPACVRCTHAYLAVESLRHTSLSEPSSRRQAVLCRSRTNPQSDAAAAIDGTLRSAMAEIAPCVPIAAPALRVSRLRCWSDQGDGRDRGRSPRANCGCTAAATRLDELAQHGEALPRCPHRTHRRVRAQASVI
jgi:hypothetical protein